MLQVSKSGAEDPSRLEGIFSEPPTVATAFDYALNFMRRRIWYVILPFLLMNAIGAGYLFITPLTFTANSVVLIDSRKFQLFQQQANLGEQQIDSGAALESQIEIAKSESIALKVIQQLHLANNPEFASGFPIPLAPGLLKSPESETKRIRNAARVFGARLKVKRIGMTFAMEISFESISPELAAKIANAVADAYVAEQLDLKYQATRVGSAWLEGRLKELRDEVNAAQSAVLEYKAKHSIVDTGAGRLMTDQRVADLSGQLAGARARNSEARARLDRINILLAEQQPESGLLDAGINDPSYVQSISKLRVQYVELTNREADISQKFGRNHQAAVALRTQMRDIRTVVASELRRLQDGYKNDLDLAIEQEKNLQLQLDAALGQSQVSSQAQVKLRELETSAQTYRTLYDNFVRRHAEAIEQQSFPSAEARVITVATAPSQGNHRKRLLIFAAIPGMGLLLGFGLGALRDLTDGQFRTSEQVEKSLHLNCIAMVPALRQRRPQGSQQQAERQVIAQSRSPSWAVVNLPFSRFAESIRSIKLSIDFREMTKSGSVVGFTSSAPNEGKSTVSSALALSLAQSRAKVIIVDCDLRNPSITRDFAPDASCGLLEVLSGRMPLNSALWTDAATSLSFLPAVFPTPTAHSSEILSSQSMKDLVETLRTMYDYVILDFPPLAPLVDVRATTPLVDGYVLVVEWGITNVSVARLALSKAYEVYENTIGVVLNKVDMKMIGRYEGTRAGYYNNKMYSRYGYED